MEYRGATGAMSAAQVREKSTAILDQLRRVVVGKSRFLEKLVCLVLAGGHVLIEDLPGVAKTLTVRSLAGALGLSFRRIQFTPDLLPGDITGTHIYNSSARTFELVEGPIFTQLLLADEINRASPKTQSALLEAMEEQQVTLDGTTRALSPPFIVVATQNPIEHEGTFTLPEAQLDRFMAKLTVGYPTPEEQVEIMQRHGRPASKETPVEEVCGCDELIAMRAGVESVEVDASLLDYIAALVEASRTSEFVAVGASPRAGLALLRIARARAAMDGRDFVVPDDVKFLAFEVLAHRIIVKPEMWGRGIASEEIAASIIGGTAVPK